ncbi:protein cordon-bleu isoform X2 [Lepus europaeus]|uniref:protein cordon-bleu isoform X2 n=1 Tax=Lepus europaeus TaxID=9983 RepID=UPI002B491CCD|nr:protein cordon-bleu isoform X2 [Lepus europaeus]
MDAQSASAAKPPTGKKMKARAPPPPGKPAPLDALGQQRPPGSALSLQRNLVPVKEAQRDGPLDITVVLPSGLEKQSVVSGSQAMMDLLVELCLQNHLNPSHHALEVQASETRQPLSFKPNTPVGTLDVHTVFLKEKVPEEKAKPGPPKAPETSVRLVVNYLRTQKAVVRVSPEVPLQNILPIICAKCDVSPDHVVLLRDIGGEELELSKSLRELGVKELYAWDNRGETFRKSSLGNEEANKEKKTFLGFFKASKSSSSKAEQPGLSGVDSEEDTLKPAPGRGLNGCSTTPNSPSMPSRSLTLGPSLSLGNVSGVSLRSEMKKRRAPPPPSAGPPVQDKVSEKVSLGSQMDLQKKKRRAPAPPPPQPPPPPPSPLVPSRTEDSEEKRKSAVGVGRQVPQKPPRGTARGPPQLVLPPPPPYPPPDTDAAEPLGFPGEGAGSEASDLRPKLSLPLGPTGVDGVAPVPVEAEETASVGSCFASEDTTEDSGVMSSPSDIVSLDSQHDSVKSKDKWATDQEDSSDQDFAGTPELGPPKSPPWDRNSPGSTNPRAGRVATATGDGDSDFLLVGQFQRALVEFEGDTEDMEESYGTDSNSLTSSSTGESHHSAREAPASDGDADAIPVTFIGEVPDDPLDLGVFCNRNNNAGSFDTEDAASRRAHLSPFQAGHSQPHARVSTAGPDPQAPSRDASATSATHRNGHSAAAGPLGTAFASRLHADERNMEKDPARGPACGEKTQATENTRPPALTGKDSRASSAISAPLAWYQQGQTPGGSYGLRHGLTTYKIVPAKSETRRYNRAGSLSLGAIMIDELGDLVSPHTNTRTISSAPSPPDADPQPVEKVREFWRCNSMDKPSGPTKRPLPASTSVPPSTCTSAPTSASVVLAQPLHPDGRPRAVNTPTAPRPQSAAQEAGTHLEEGRSRPLSLSVVTCHTQVPATGSTEVMFPRPQRRTSSQYVASAIARRIGPPKAQQHGSSEKSHAGRAPAPAAQPLLAPCLSSETQGHKGSAEQTCVVGSAAGAHPRGDICSPQGKPSSPGDSLPSVPIGSGFPRGGSSRRDHVSVEQACGFTGKQSTRNQKPGTASDPVCPRNGARPLTQQVADTQAPSGTVLLNGSAWALGSRGLPGPPSGSGTEHGRAVSQLSVGQCVSPGSKDTPQPLPSNVHDTDGAPPLSIFGPKKKFRPVVQRPVPEDTSLHSALMQAIVSAGGTHTLRKTAELNVERGPKKPSYTEAESERSALLAAIRGHSGSRSLRKVSSSASEELQIFRDAARSAAGPGDPWQEDPAPPPPPALPPPALPASRALSASGAASRSSTGTLDNPVDARQALMDAIRSGTGAARLKKVPLLV